MYYNKSETMKSERSNLESEILYKTRVFVLHLHTRYLLFTLTIKHYLRRLNVYKMS